MANNQDNRQSSDQKNKTGAGDAEEGNIKEVKNKLAQCSHGFCNAVRKNPGTAISLAVLAGALVGMLLKRSG